MNRKERRAAAAGARHGRQGADPVRSAATELYEQIFQAGAELGARILAKGLLPAHVYELVDGAVALAGTFMARDPTSPSALACRPGCDACCHRPVGTSAPVVLRIAAAMREGLSGDDLAAALARVVALDEKTHGRAWTPSERPPLACAFLVQGTCSIYPIRPFVCRAWNSADAEACRRALGQDSVELRFDLYQRTTFAAVEKGIQAALRARALDPADLELTAAVRVALENPDACDRWLAGENVFAGCEAKPARGDPRRRLPFVD